MVPVTGPSPGSFWAIRVMIEKFAVAENQSRSEFLDLNHTSGFMNLVSLGVPKFASEPGRKCGRTSEPGH